MIGNFSNSSHSNVAVITKPFVIIYCQRHVHMYTLAHDHCINTQMVAYVCTCVHINKKSQSRYILLHLLGLLIRIPIDMNIYRCVKLRKTPPPTCLCIFVFFFFPLFLFLFSLLFLFLFSQFNIIRY